MLKACDLKKGNVVEINNEVYVVKHIDVKTPSARGAVTLYKVRFTHIRTKQKYEESYKGNDPLNEVALQRKPVQYLYPDGELHVFMDNLEYAQYMIAGDTIEDDLIWLLRFRPPLSLKSARPHPASRQPAPRRGQSPQPFPTVLKSRSRNILNPGKRSKSTLKQESICPGPDSALPLCSFRPKTRFQVQRFC
jgi:translation elongation factor P/translation initiation factor 5A